MLPKLVQHLLNGLDVFYALVLGVDEDVIKVHYDENVELLYRDLVDITQEYGRCVGQSKGHHLVLKMAIAGPKGCLPFVAFSDLYSIISIGQIKLGEASSPN